jgi:hypothetical protein
VRLDTGEHHLAPTSLAFRPLNGLKLKWNKLRLRHWLLPSQAGARSVSQPPAPGAGPTVGDVSGCNNGPPRVWSKLTIFRNRPPLPWRDITARKQSYRSAQTLLLSGSYSQSAQSASVCRESPLAPRPLSRRYARLPCARNYLLVGISNATDGMQDRFQRVNAWLPAAPKGRWACPDVAQLGPAEMSAMWPLSCAYTT